MRKLIVTAIAVAGMAALAACQSPQDEAAEQEADALEAQADAAPTAAQADALNAQADQVEQQAGNADGGLTTSNTTPPPSVPATANPAQAGGMTTPAT